MTNTMEEVIKALQELLPAKQSGNSKDSTVKEPIRCLTTSAISNSTHACANKEKLEPLGRDLLNTPKKQLKSLPLASGSTV